MNISIRVFGGGAFKAPTEGRTERQHRAQDACFACNKPVLFMMPDRVPKNLPKMIPGQRKEKFLSTTRYYRIKKK